MDLKSACDNILSQLRCVIGQLNEEEYKRPVPVLNDATIGQHVRHTLEFFVCLMDGHKFGVVNYDQRKRDRSIEESKDVATEKIKEIGQFIHTTHVDHPMYLNISYDKGATNQVRIHTNYERELAYNIEHAVHHMAIIKIGLQALNPTLDIPEGFGVAVSTIRYQEANS